MELISKDISTKEIFLFYNWHQLTSMCKDNPAWARGLAALTKFTTDQQTISYSNNYDRLKKQTNREKGYLDTSHIFPTSRLVLVGTFSLSSAQGIRKVLEIVLLNISSTLELCGSWYSQKCDFTVGVSGWPIPVNLSSSSNLKWKKKYYISCKNNI